MTRETRTIVRQGQKDIERMRREAETASIGAQRQKEILAEKKRELDRQYKKAEELVAKTKGKLSDV